MKCPVLLLSAVTALTLTARIEAVEAPHHLKLERATYRKISFSWRAPADVQVAGYRIYRNGAEVMQSEDPRFSEAALTPGSAYTYEVAAVTVGGAISDRSVPLVVHTMRSVPFERHQELELLVDSLHSLSALPLDAVSLLAAVRTGWESLTGEPVIGSLVDDPALHSLITRELAAIQLGEGALDDADRQSMQSELDAILQGDFNGLSFEQLVLFEKLGELAEARFRAGDLAGAEALYRTAIKFSTVYEPGVEQVLDRISYMKRRRIPADAAAVAVAAAMEEITDDTLEFFEYFPDSTGKSAKNIYQQLLHYRFCRFPQVLGYDQYHEAYFLRTQQLAAALTAMDPEGERSRKLSERIEAWKLTRLPVSLANPAGNPVSGVLRVTDRTAETDRRIVLPDPENYPVVREIAVHGSALIPLYSGHVYELSCRIPVPGGADFELALPLLPENDGDKVVYEVVGGSPSVIPGTGESGGVAITAGEVSYPYLLRAEKKIDLFDLSWEFVPAPGWELAEFRVYRGDTLVKVTASPLAAELPLEPGDGVYTYSVVACGRDGSVTRASLPLTVMPGDQSQYAAFFDWLHGWFGDRPMLSNEDPDGDGVTNYQEFLAASDPTRAPSVPVSTVQLGYAKVTLAFPGVPAEGTRWQLSRNGAEVTAAEGAGWTDSPLIPGMRYDYRLRRITVDGVPLSDWSEPLTVVTLKTVSIADDELLRQVVDLIHPLDLAAASAPNLIAAVKTAFTALLGTEVSFTLIDEELVRQLTESELELLRQALPQPETGAARAELDAILQEGFAGHTFEDLYINEKLQELAEAHVAQYRRDPVGHPNSLNAARELFRAALPFLGKSRLSVLNTINRLGLVEMQSLPENPSRAELRAAIERHRDAHLIYFDYFDDVKEKLPMHPYAVILHNYFRYFPQLLGYDDYDTELFAAAVQFCDALDAQDSQRLLTDFTARIRAWRLAALQLDLVGASPDAAGELTIRNVSGQRPNSPVPPAYSEVRTFDCTERERVLPVYAGHWYEVELNTPVPGGVPWRQKLGPLCFKSGERVVWDPFTGPTTEPAASEAPELEIRYRQPEAPYNLRAELQPDTFTLTWDYVAPAGLETVGYQVYRGGEPAGSSATPMLAGVPRQVYADGVYLYRVAALSRDGAVGPLSGALEVLPEFSAEELRYYQWKKHYFGAAAVVFAEDDADGDGLTNAQEYELGSNPVLAPPADWGETVFTRQPGVPTRYIAGGWDKVLPDLALESAYDQTVLSEFCFATSGEILSSGRATGVGVELTGYFDVPESGEYHFYLSSDDGSRLWIDDAMILTVDEPNSTQEAAVRKSLVAGPHRFRVEYCNQDGGSRLQLHWSGPDFSRRRFDREALWHPADSDGKLEEFVAWQKDSDRDGLTDAQELGLGTDRFAADSDGDGLSDYDELNQTLTNPLNPDSNGNGIFDREEQELADLEALDGLFFQPLLRLPGQAYLAATGLWSRDGETARAEGTRGSLTYEFQLTEPGVGKVGFLLRDLWNRSGTCEFNLYLDGIFLRRSDLDLNGDSARMFSALTPYLTAGAHRVTLVWDNYRDSRKLVVDSVTIDRLAVQNDAADVTGLLLAGRNPAVAQTVSRTSPASVTGEARFPELVKVNGSAAEPFSERGWHAEVALSETGAVPVTIEYENGGRESAYTLAWQPTDLRQENGKTLRIRRGDALLVTMTGKDGGAGSWRITRGEAELTGTAAESSVLRFLEDGSFTLRGACTGSDGATVEAEVTVEVLSYEFRRAEVACWLGFGRQWEEPGLPAGAALALDPRLTVGELDYSTGAATLITAYADDDRPRYVMARIGEDGPVLAVQQICGVGIYSSNRTSVSLVEEYEDGTRLYEMPVVKYPNRADVRLDLNIFVPGVLFEDGTVSKVIEAGEFDDTGRTLVRFLYPPETRTSVCHHLGAYQNGEFMGYRR